MYIRVCIYIYIYIYICCPTLDDNRIIHNAAALFGEVRHFPNRITAAFNVTVAYLASNSFPGYFAAMLVVRSYPYLVCFIQS